VLASRHQHLRICAWLTRRISGLQDDREKDPAFVSDAYAECYPAFHDFGTTVVDSDEEDMSHMDKKMVRLCCVKF
jgi:RED-like protein C-terminal region